MKSPRVWGMEQAPYQTRLHMLEAECGELRWALQDRGIWEAAINDREEELTRLIRLDARQTTEAEEDRLALAQPDGSDD